MPSFLNPKWFWPGLKLVISVSLLVTLFKSISVTESEAVLKNINLQTLLAVLILSGLQTVLSYVRWRIALGSLDTRLKDSLKIFSSANLLNHILPGGMAGDVFRFVKGKRQQQGNLVFFSILHERLSLILAIALMFFLIQVLSWDLDLLTGITGMVIVSYGFFFPGQWKIVTLSLMIHLCTLFILLLPLMALAPPTILFWQKAPLFLLSLCLPISANGWGLREWSATYLFSDINWTHEGILLSAITSGLASMLAAGALFTISRIRFRYAS